MHHRNDLRADFLNLYLDLEYAIAEYKQRHRVVIKLRKPSPKRKTRPGKK